MRLQILDLIQWLMFNSMIAEWLAGVVFDGAFSIKINFGGDFSCTTSLLFQALGTCI